MKLLGALLCFSLATIAHATSFGVMAQSNAFGATPSALLVGAQFQRITVPIAYKFCDTTASVCSYAYSTSTTAIGTSGGNSITLQSVAGMTSGDTMSASVLSGNSTFTISGNTVTWATATLTQNVYSWAAQQANLAASQAASIPVYLLIRNSCTAYITGSCPEQTTSAAYKADVTYTVQTICGPISSCLFVVIESEPDIVGNTGSYTIAQYLTMLTDAVTALHAINVKVADGGLGSANNAEYQWACMMYTDCFSVRASTAQQRLADQFARNVFYQNSHTGAVYNLLPTCAAPNDSFLAGASFVATNVANVTLLEAGFATSGEDYQNLHNYYLTPMGVLTILQGYAARRAVPIVQGEIGNDVDQVAWVTGMLSISRALAIPYTLDWDFDTAGGTVLALSDGSGVLRAQGTAFASYLASPTATMQQQLSYTTC